jgi:hypothetical protein
MNDEIISKIKKLRELSKSDNINEAAQAAKTADRLISKYRISEQEIGNHISEEISQDETPLYESARAISWKYNLACIIAKHYSCYIYNHVGSSETGRKITRLVITGVKSDREIVHYMFNWLMFEIETLNKRNKGKGHLYCNSYCTGAVNGIFEQLEASKVEQTQSASESEVVALAKLDLRAIKAEELARAKNKIKNYTKTNHSKLLSDPYYTGVNAGKNIHLGKGLNGVGNKLLGQ